MTFLYLIIEENASLSDLSDLGSSSVGSQEDDYEKDSKVRIEIVQSKFYFMIKIDNIRYIINFKTSKGLKRFAMMA